MRKYYQRRLPEDPSKDYYYIIRETSPMQSLLVEYGFIDNANDRVRLQNNLLDYVEAVVRAIAQYAGVPYTGPEGGSSNFYTVVRGDSLWSIANRFGVTVQQLKDANNLTSDVLSVGQVLRIPSSNNGGSTGSFRYTVQKGDSLWSIASRYGVSVNALREANNLSSDTLSIGQVLIIPGVSSGEEDNEGDNNETVPSTTYTVVRGDSLWSIANRFGVTVQQLRDANNLTSDTLSVGQVLIIPGVSNDDGDNESDNNGAVFNYTVVRGDSLWSIANRFGVTVQQLRDANNLASDTLSVGQVLIIPGISAGDDLEDGDTNGSVPSTTYTVQSGDSLWSIANKFGVTVNELKQANNLTSNLLSVGQVLVIPDNNVDTGFSTYTVVRGDSLWSIANRFGVSVDAIKSLNNLTSNLLSVGQVLQIPNF